MSLYLNERPKFSLLPKCKIVYILTRLLPFEKAVLGLHIFALDHHWGSLRISLPCKPNNDPITLFLWRCCSTKIDGNDLLFVVQSTRLSALLYNTIQYILFSIKHNTMFIARQIFPLQSRQRFLQFAEEQKKYKIWTLYIYKMSMKF